MKYFCCVNRRSKEIKDSVLNGIDYLEVLDDMSLPDEERQYTLFVHFIKSLTGSGLTKKNIRIEGGERVKNITVKGEVSIGAGEKAKILTVPVDKRGDFSIYTFRLIKDANNINVPPDGFDKIFSAVDFSFKVNCYSEFDCKKERICPVPPGQDPEINYLSKDYTSFKQLMLDRMAVLMPQWKERHAADLGIALVELLAYVSDYLSYEQDVVTTEAYLSTARRRTSVRRHARLVDYFMHDGCNSRVWLYLQVEAQKVELKKRTQQGTTKFLTKVSKQSCRIQPNSSAYDQAMAERPEVFELIYDATLFQKHNRMSFYTWHARECCLPKGATRATLSGHYPDLKAGDVLIFKEEIGPLTGESEDADPMHCHAVCLTEVLAGDKQGQPLTDPLNGQEITEISWHSEDALPFALCISAVTDADHNSKYVEDVSIVLGNIVLADHGLTETNEELESVPKSIVKRVPKSEGDRCVISPPEPIPPRFRPKLKKAPLTHAAKFDETTSLVSASAMMRWKTEDIIPAIYLITDKNATVPEWLPKRDLLRSHRDKKEFVVEVEQDGKAYLRFGDNVNGMRPASGMKFYACYRIGNGTQGNIGSKSLVHIITEEAGIVEVCNPIPACGGVDPESMERVRQNAPSAFRTQERAVTADDYAQVAGQHTGVQRAAASFRWTGSWYTAFLTIDRLHGLEVNAAFEERMRKYIETYRMAGHDVEVDGPQFVSLEVEMLVCVKPGYFRSDVKAALLDIFSNRILPDGRRGIFHPDNFTFGQPVYMSHLYKAAQEMAGVASVQIKTFQRQDDPSTDAVDSGKLDIGRLEIARLDNDPNYPKHGVFKIIAKGGK